MLWERTIMSVELHTLNEWISSHHSLRKNIHSWSRQITILIIITLHSVFNPVQIFIHPCEYSRVISRLTGTGEGCYADLDPRFSFLCHQRASRITLDMRTKNIIHKKVIIFLNLFIYFLMIWNLVKKIKMDPVNFKS